MDSCCQSNILQNEKASCNYVARLHFLSLSLPFQVEKRIREEKKEEIKSSATMQERCRA